MTIDNVVDGISYEGTALDVQGDLNNWNKEKTFTFSTCDRNNPGTLMVDGTDTDNSPTNCLTGGMIMHCTCEDTLNPWHNFVSDTVNWKLDDESTLCTSEANFVRAGQNLPFIQSILAADGKSIWSQTEGEVALLGTPGYCEVICSFTVDAKVFSVFHSGQQLFTEGQTDDWTAEKKVNFTACDRLNPGTLTIAGTHDETSGDNCINGGLILHCTAEDSQSPWHNFVSNDRLWVDADDDSMPCQDDGTSGFLGSLTSGSFIETLQDNGAKKIWADKTDVILIGTPGNLTNSSI